MAELVGIIASIITITGVALESSKGLYKIAKDFRAASRTLNDLLTEISTVQALLNSLEIVLGNTRENSLSQNLRQCLQDFYATMEAFSRLCDEFKERINCITKHSNDVEFSRRDKVRLYFEEKELTTFKYHLGSYKLTINIVLSLITLISSNQNRQIIDDLHRDVATAVAKISGQIEGLDISVQTLSRSSIIIASNATVLDDLQREQRALGQCLRVSQSAVNAAPSEVKASITHMESYGEAQQIVAMTEGISGVVDIAVAHDSSRMLFLDKLSADGSSNIVNQLFLPRA